jgi:leader peptidase (prepilin peptidase)/N-methyltransferase
MTRIRSETVMSVPTSPDTTAARTGTRVGSITIGLVVGAVAVVLVATVTGWGSPGAVAATPLVPAWVAAVFDVRTRTLPDVVVAIAAGLAVFVGVSVRGASGLLLVATGAALMALPLLAVHAVRPGALGFGDVKLGGALGATLGVSSPDVATVLLLALVALAAASAVGLVIAAAARRGHVPFGAPLVGGATMVLMFADRLGGVPLSWQ